MDSAKWSMVGLLIASVSLAVASAAAEPPTNEKVEVGVYYETLCPDSKKFVTEQLFPVFMSPLANYMNLTLVPYGKATTTKNETTGMYNFTCHHGDRECWGNKIHACAIKNYDEIKRMQFINCTMALAEKDKEYPIDTCAEMLTMNTDVLKNCGNSTEIDELLAQMGAMTDKIDKPLKQVPTVVFNNKLNQTELEAARMNFKKELCSKIMKKPKECMTAPSSANSIAFAATLLPSMAALILAMAY